MICAVALLLTGCGGGKISGVQKVIGGSEIFSPREIEAAMELALDYFRKEFDGCTMTVIKYNEEKLKVLYVNPMGTFIQVFLQKI
jgi:hypothetical protein